MLNTWAKRRFFAAEDGGAAAAAADPGAAAAAAAAAADPGAAAAAAAAASKAPEAKWWEGLAEHQRAYLTPKGLTVDDPMQALPKIIDIAANAEKRIGKGIDSIMDKPAKDQAFADWARANAEALGLPADANGYEVKPPENWPKDLPWNDVGEKAAREVALAHGVHPAAHQAYINLQAQMVMELEKSATEGLNKARAEMTAELQKEWGDQTEARKLRAGQTMQAIAEQAGMTAEHIQALSQTMSGATSDAAVIRLMDVVAEMMADDKGIAMGRGSSQFGMTPAEARAELARFQSPEGEYGKAFAAGDQRKLAELRGKREQLSKLATQ